MKRFRMHSTRKHALMAIATLGLCAAAGLAQAADPMTSATGGNLSSDDRSFVEKATIGGMTEVQAGKLAQQKGSSPAVKDFGAKMVADHTKAGAELAKIATAKNVTPPGTLDKSHKSDIDKLSEKSGADFDKAFMKQMISDHKSTISLFEKEAKSAKDGDLKSFAGSTLPTLQDHLKMAQSVSDGLK
jgi:putative membrane protein